MKTGTNAYSHRLYATVPCTLRVRRPPSLLRAPAGICGRKKLPFAGYSVVKEQNPCELSAVCVLPAARRPRRPILPAGTFYSTIRAQRAQAEPQRICKTTRYRSLPGSPAEARVAWYAFRPSVCRAKAGGEYRARTGDLLVANQALSQLS